MSTDEKYYLTENSMVIYDTHGERYSVIPAGIALYPQGKDENNIDEYYMYVNLQGDFKHTINNTGVINQLYLSEFDREFKREDPMVLTKKDLIRVLQKNSITKDEFANIIKDFKDKDEKGK